MKESYEDFVKWLESFPPAEEAIKELKANYVPLDSDREFVADYLKGYFVEEVLRVMEEQHLSKSDLAKRLGRTRQYVSRVLNETANFTLDSMARIACALEMRLALRMHTASEYVVARPLVKGVAQKGAGKRRRPAARAGGIGAKPGGKKTSSRKAGIQSE